MYAYSFLTVCPFPFRETNAILRKQPIEPAFIYAADRAV